MTVVHAVTLRKIGMASSSSSVTWCTGTMMDLSSGDRLGMACTAPGPEGRPIADMVTWCTRD
jgi:hypothetical protein